MYVHGIYSKKESNKVRNRRFSVNENLKIHDAKQKNISEDLLSNGLSLFQPMVLNGKFKKIEFLFHFCN